MDRKIVKAAAALLLLLAALCSLCAAAEEIDLSRMSDAELTALLEQVNGEIAARGIEKTAKLAKGTYIAGVDIPAGRYVYTCLAVGEDWGNLTVRTERGSGKQVLWEIVSAPENGEEPDTVFVTLSDGDELKSGVPFSLTIMAGIAFR